MSAFVLLLLLASMALLGAWAWRQPPAERPTLGLALAVAFLTRLALMVVLHASGAWFLTPEGAFTPDEALADMLARQLASGDPRSPGELTGSWHISWLVIMEALYERLAPSLIIVKLLNVVLGTAALLPLYHIARRLGGVDVARLSVWLLALFPSSIGWSATTLREPLIILLIALLVAAAIEVFEGPPRLLPRTAPVLAVLAVGLIVLSFTRLYLAVLFIPLIVVASVTATMHRREPRVLRNALFAIALAVVGVALTPGGGALLGSTSDFVLVWVGRELAVPTPSGAIFQDARGGGATTSTTRAAGLEEEAETDHSLVAAGLGPSLLHAVLGARPQWRPQDIYLLTQPGTFVWWAVLPSAAYGCYQIARSGRRWAHLMLVGGLMAAIIAFLTVTGNGIRHHYMIEPLGLILGAAGYLALRSGGTWQRHWVSASTGVLAAAATVSFLASLL